MLHLRNRALVQACLISLSTDKLFVYLEKEKTSFKEIIRLDGENKKLDTQYRRRKRGTHHHQSCQQGDLLKGLCSIPPPKSSLHLAVWWEGTLSPQAQIRPAGRYQHIYIQRECRFSLQMIDFHKHINRS